MLSFLLRLFQRFQSLLVQNHFLFQYTFERQSRKIVLGFCLDKIIVLKKYYKKKNFKLHLLHFFALFCVVLTGFCVVFTSFCVFFYLSLKISILKLTKLWGSWVYNWFSNNSEIFRGRIKGRTIKMSTTINSENSINEKGVLELMINLFFD